MSLFLPPIEPRYFLPQEIPESPSFEARRKLTCHGLAACLLKITTKVEVRGCEWNESTPHKLLDVHTWSPIGGTV